VIISNISTAKNELSRLLHLVQSGETVTILDRKKAIPRIVPIAEVGEESLSAKLSEMAAKGQVMLPEKQKELPASLKNFRQQRNGKSVGALDALLSEREEGP
jgi:antitoxin (DNA-binding transcriptional repressor) of toxin-antitoxin stability system